MSRSSAVVDARRRALVGRIVTVRVHPAGRVHPDVRVVLTGGADDEALVRAAARSGAVVDGRFTARPSADHLARLVGLVGRCTLAADDSGAHEIASALHRVGLQTGVALGRHVPVEAAFRLLDEVDAVTVVSDVSAGRLEPGALAKIMALRHAIDERAGRGGGRPVALVVDAVNAPSASLSVAAGADALVAVHERDVAAIEQAVAQELAWTG